MCKSVRGAAFFGSSVHVITALFMLFWFLFDTVINEVGVNLWKCDEKDGIHQRSLTIAAHYLNLLFKFIYFTLLSITGIYIFRGVERASPRVLKFSTLAFIILQIISIVIFAVFVAFAWENEKENDLIEEFEPVPTSIANVENATTNLVPEVTSTEIGNVGVGVGVGLEPSGSRKMSHNELVSFVFQVLGVVFNSLGSIVYSGILIRYLVTL